MSVPNDRPLVENSADAQQIKKARKREKADARAHAASVKEVLETKAGRYVFKHYISLCGLFRRREHATPVEELQFHEGQRHIGISMLLDVEQARPDLISIMKDT